MSSWRSLLPNAWYIAMREYRGRVSSRSFVVGTILLAVLIFGATQIPTAIDYIGGSSQTKVALVSEAPKMPADAAKVLDSALNGSAAQPGSTDHREFVLTWLGGDVAAAQQRLQDGEFEALVVITRNSSTGDLVFTCRTDLASDGRQLQLIANGVDYLTIDDRLARAGVSLSAVQAPAQWAVVPIKPAKDGAPATVNSISGEVSSTLTGTALIVLIFMAIITYGTWVAMSVAEEKGSRVMELMLNAATPFQMLTGKVLGNGAAGLTQYGAVMLAAVAGLLLQGPIRQATAGGSASGDSLGGMSLAVFGAFIVLFLLGFLFYALLYAALGSLVSRQEDIQSATSPLMMVIMAGYLMSVFAIQMINDTWVVVLSFVPFFSPYLMLARVAGGHVELWEFALTVVLMLAASAVALFAAARIYSAGVLLYGQRVGLRQVFKAARVSR